MNSPPYAVTLFTSWQSYLTLVNRGLLALLIVLITTCLYGQDTIPSGDARATFLQDMREFVDKSNDKEVLAAYENFASVFSGSTFTEEERQAIVYTGNTMLAKRMTARNQVQKYFRVLTQIKTDNTGGNQLLEWNQLLNDEFLSPDYRVNTVTNLLNFSLDFYERNALQYSTSGGISWFAFGENHRWKNENGPRLLVENATLTALRSDDSLLITQTNLTVDPLERTLVGNGGKTNWERTSLGAAVSVELEKYNVKLNRSLYEAEVAHLTFPLYFGGKTLQGTFSDKLVSDNNRTSYPRFESDARSVDIRNVGEGVRLRGRFRLHGSTVYAAGDKEQPAELLVVNQLKQPRFVGYGNLVSIKDQGRIVGENVESLLYLGTDSLYHPSVDVKFNLADYSLELSRGKVGVDRYPFYHSLHRMNIDADYIQAFLREDRLVIGRPTASFVNKEDVIFESLEYFNKGEYRKIQSIGSANPLAIMKATAQKEGIRFMRAGLLAERINSKFDVETIKPLLYDLVSKGFILYDPETEMIEMKDKIYHFVDADAGNKDYDFLQLVSKSDTANAVIDLNKGYTLLNGLSSINFSRNQRVAARPTGGQAFLKGNRNFDFDGKLFAGFTVFEGKDFKFTYDEFQVKMDSVRYFDFYVPTGDVDKNKQPVAYSIGSRIEHLNGVLLIDAPNNKSGRNDIPIFPSLQSKTNSYVFYDRDSTLNGAYVRDSFYFELKPFSFDHLDRYGPQDLRFEGQLFSNGIFPDIEETLVLREEDQSLGFSNETPTEGYPAYTGKGQYTGTVDLSNRGLLGQGQLDYLQATVNAEDFTFKPDVATASADAFDLTENRKGAVPVPEVHGEQVSIEWRPYADSLIVNSQEETPFELFKQNDHQLDGTLVLTPDGLKGAGQLEWSQAVANSKIFSFSAFSAEADTMNIRIKALEVDDRLALETKNVQGQLNFDEQTGHFEANDENVVTTLPYNQYSTSMNEFDWDIEGNTITFVTEEGQLANFVSIHPDQDSLIFAGEEATYDLTTSLLHINGVERMVSADAFIYPDSQYVEVAPNAK
ncbi:MAG: hypothetical protein AAGJ82_11810, partial [Bacteroidota bacterium]